MSPLIENHRPLARRKSPTPQVFRHSLHAFAFLAAAGASSQAQTMYLVSELGIHRADLSNPDSFTPQLVYANANVRSLAVTGDACDYSVVWQERQPDGTNPRLFRTGLDLDFDAPVELAHPPPTNVPTDLIGADSDYMYFDENGYYRSNVADGGGYSIAPFQLNTPSLSAIGSIAFSGGFVYWTTKHGGTCDGEGDNVPGCGVVTEGVYRVPTTGGSTETVTSGAAGDVICGHNYFAVAAASGSVAYYRRCQIDCCIPSAIGDACGCGTDLTGIYDCNGATGFVLDGAVVLPIDLSTPVDIHTASATTCDIRRLLAALDSQHGHLYWTHTTYPNLMRVAATGALTEIGVPFTIRDIDIAHGATDPSTTFDLSVVYVEASQGIPQQPQPFVSEKPIFVRAYIHYEGQPPSSSHGWDGLLHILDAEDNEIRPPLPSDNGPKATYNFPSGDVPSPAIIEADTLNFLLDRDDLTSTQWSQLHSLKVGVNPCQGIPERPQYQPLPENDASNNSSTRLVELTCRKSPTIRYYPTTVETPSPLGPDNALITPGIGDHLYRSMYPIPFYEASSGVYADGGAITVKSLQLALCLFQGDEQGSICYGRATQCYVECLLGCALKEAQFRDTLAFRTTPDIRVCWLPLGVGQGAIVGLTANNNKGSYATADQGSGQLIFAHEIGHTADVEPSDLAGPPPNKGRLAYDVYASPEQRIAQRPFALMSYAPVDDHNHTHWATLNEHARLLFWSMLQCTAQGACLGPTFTPTLVVAGLYRQAAPERIVLDDIVEVESVATLSDPTGILRIRLTATAPSGSITDDILFNPTCSVSANADVCWFSVFAPTTVSGQPVDKLEIVQADGLVLADAMRSAHAPTIRLALLTSTIHDGDVVEWLGNDQDGDMLTYYVLYSACPGCPWHTLVSGTHATAIRLDTSSLPGSDVGVGQIRLIGTDGFNTAIDVADGLTLEAKKPPSVTIITPQNGDIFRQAAAIRAEAMVLDPEDGRLEPKQITWTSDRDGFLGLNSYVSLRALSVGTHVLSVTATDSDDMSSQATVSIEIRAVRDDCVPVVPSDDCDGNAIRDDCEAQSGSIIDCNSNRYPDACDIASGQSTDVDHNGIPDDCQADLIHGACCTAMYTVEGQGVFVCLPNTIQNSCNGPLDTFSPNQTCDNVACIPRGACCVNDSASPSCLDASLQGECAAASDVWHVAATCSNVSCEQQTQQYGACCSAYPSGAICRDHSTQSDCAGSEQHWLPNVACGAIDCSQPPLPTIPTLSNWGLIVLVLLILAAAKLSFGRRPRTTN